MKKLLFTDLDGTLLDLETYSPELVRASVKNLKAAGVSIIFCSSKTWAEQEHYLKELELDEPVIVENGSGIFLPQNSNLSIKNRKPINDKHIIALGKSYDEILSAVRESANRYYPTLKYYDNLSIAEISRITGLPSEAAQKAKMRNYSETIFNADPQSDAYTKFENALKSHGLQCISGSKYITITSVESDKGRAVKILIDAYQHKYGKVTSYGAGDSLNDFAMLEVVDFPYLVQKPDSSWADINLNRLTKVSKVGPTGWKIIAREILML